jgi:hypothetical protein
MPGTGAEHAAASATAAEAATILAIRILFIAVLGSSAELRTSTVNQRALTVSMPDRSRFAVG